MVKLAELASRFTLPAAVAGVVILRKGVEDMVTDGRNVYVFTNNKGSPRRCGGQVCVAVLTLHIHISIYYPSLHFTSLLILNRLLLPPRPPPPPISIFNIS